MPRALVVVAHPRPGSFTHALAEAVADGFAAAGLAVDAHDLYAEGFDPLLTAAEADTTRPPAGHLADGDDLVLRHRSELASADVLAVVHPNWWGKPPAMMAGWMDRVLIPGVAYTLDDPAGAPTSLLPLSALYVVSTSDTPADREHDLFGDPLQSIWARCVAHYLGEPHTERRVLRTVTDSDADARRQWLADVTADAHRIGLAAQRRAE